MKEEIIKATERRNEEKDRKIGDEHRSQQLDMGCEFLIKFRSFFLHFYKIE